MFNVPSVSLKDDGVLVNKDIILEIIDRYDFSYLDKDGNFCHILVHNDGLILEKKTKEYSLKMELKDEGYALISSVEGNLKIALKVIDFWINDDILVMHYLIDGVNKCIEIDYRS